MKTCLYGGVVLSEDPEPEKHEKRLVGVISRKILVAEKFFIFYTVQMQCALWDALILGWSYNPKTPYFRNFWYWTIFIVIKVNENDPLDMYSVLLRPCRLKTMVLATFLHHRCFQIDSQHYLVTWAYVRIERKPKKGKKIFRPQ